MGQTLSKLTARTVASATKPGRYGDGGGLYLVVSAAGTGKWIFLYRSPTHRVVSKGKTVGRLREMGLGSAGAVSLKQARIKAAAARARLAEGSDPLDAPNDERATIPTFGVFAEDLISSLEHGWRNPKHRQQWRNTIATYCAPFARKSIDAVNTEDVLSALRPIWQEKAETASRVRGRIEKILDAAKARGFREGENPARWRGHLDNLLAKKKSLTRGHHASMPYAEVPALIARLRERDGIGARCLEFAVYTAARSGEARGARWEEIDLDARLWTITAERMKAGRPHRVPLCDRAIEILEEVRPLASNGLVFPGLRSGTPLSDMSLAAVLKRMGYGAYTVHGFRSSFKTWAAETTSFANEVSEAALAHVTGDKVQRAYQRGDVFKKRRQLMQAWARHLDGETSAEVVRLRGGMSHEI